jgi:inositol hexakisphosphate/diphosphoinositol-pentakisphosphate kinase
VEKPFDAENHYINIYYNQNEGGGCKRLFRKMLNESSSFDVSTNSIRKDGNFLYEVFLPTNGFDIKVYTLGEFYAHAEARKSPVLDGKVMRGESGKEVRYPVCLTP